MIETSIAGVLRQQLDTKTDERGMLVELYRSDWGGVVPAMVYHSITLPGVERGPHEHRQQTDVLVFPGPGYFKLRLADNRRESPTHGQELAAVVGGYNPSVWIIPPGVIHGYMNTGMSPAVTFNFPDRLYAGLHKQESVDEIRHEDEGLTMASERWVVT